MHPTDISIFFSRYDADQDGKLGFWEFSNALLPIDIRLRDDLENRNQTLELQFETKDLMKRVLRRAIDIELQMEGIRGKI